jgi:UDP:flavonoid glycosyltransferase YjiC (YdhE family)
MRILFTTSPALGHFHPLVPLARAAAPAGHTVAFACAPAFRDVVGAAGFECLPCGLDWLESEAEQAFPPLRDLPPGDDANTYWVSEIFAGAAAEPMSSDLLALAPRWQPDLVVRDPLELGGCVAAELLGVPHATAGASVFASPRAWEAIAGPQLAALWHAHGLPGRPSAALYRYLDLAGVPPSLVAGDYVAPVTHFLRPEPFDGAGPGSLPEEVSTLTDRPIVYASLGTVFNRTPGILRLMVEALRDEPIWLVLATGPSYDARELGDLPASVYAAPYIPQTLLFPRCDLVISHGGLNTVVAALCHGLPLVVIPLGADQPANAQRASDLGAASVVAPNQRTAARLRAAVRAVLGNPAYREAAERARREITAMPGVERGVTLLEQLARERKPIRRRGVM